MVGSRVLDYSYKQHAYFQAFKPYFVISQKSSETPSYHDLSPG